MLTYVCICSPLMSRSFVLVLSFIQNEFVYWIDEMTLDFHIDILYSNQKNKYLNQHPLGYTVHRVVKPLLYINSFDF